VFLSLYSDIFALENGVIGVVHRPEAFRSVLLWELKAIKHYLTVQQTISAEIVGQTYGLKYVFGAPENKQVILGIYSRKCMGWIFLIQVKSNDINIRSAFFSLDCIIQYVLYTNAQLILRYRCVQRTPGRKGTFCGY